MVVSFLDYCFKITLLVCYICCIFCSLFVEITLVWMGWLMTTELAGDLAGWVMMGTGILVGERPPYILFSEGFLLVGNCLRDLCWCEPGVCTASCIGCIN